MEMALCCQLQARFDTASIASTSGQQPALAKSGNVSCTRLQRSRGGACSRRRAMAASSPAPAPEPEFTLRCQTADGERVLQHVMSGDILRDAMRGADPPVDLYTVWGKVMNCNGGGKVCCCQDVSG